MDYRVTAAYALIMFAISFGLRLVPKLGEYRDVISDALYLIGAGTIVCGLWRVSPTVGMIAAGIGLVALGWVISVGGDEL